MREFKYSTEFQKKSISRKRKVYASLLLGMLVILFRGKSKYPDVEIIDILYISPFLLAVLILFNYFLEKEAKAKMESTILIRDNTIFEMQNQEIKKQIEISKILKTEKTTNGIRIYKNYTADPYFIDIDDTIGGFEEIKSYITPAL
jgi:hypothetical protein